MGDASGSLVLNARPTRRWPRLSADLAGMVAAVIACSAWSVATLAGALGQWAAAERALNWLLIMGPLAALLLALLWRPHSPRAIKLCLAWTLTVAVGVEGVALIGTNKYYGWIPLVVALAAVVTWRWPIAAIGLSFALAGTYGTIQAYAFGPAPLVDLVLAGSWLGLGWAYLTGRRSPPRAVPIALVLLGLYLVITLVIALLGDRLYPSLYSFRQSAWWMTAVILVAYLLQRRSQREQLQKLLLAAGALVGAYAMLRWAIGPSNNEEEIVRGGGQGYVLSSQGDLRLFGSLSSPQALGAWCSVMLPFSLASAMGPLQLPWRLVALFVTVSSGLALIGADTRAPIAAVVAGVLVTLVLFATGPSLAGRKFVPLALAFVCVIGAGSAFAVTKLSGDNPNNQRFIGLLHPFEDLSVQSRLVKWETILADVDGYPFGHGMGASGSAEQKYARFSSSASYDPDSSYIKVAYDEGFMVMILFAVAMIALVLELARRGVSARDPASATLAIGACGGVLAFVIDMNATVYFEGLGALQPWVIAGLGLAPFVNAPPRLPGAALRVRREARAEAR